MSERSRWVQVCAAETVPELEGRRVVVNGFYVAVFNTEEGFLQAGHRAHPRRALRPAGRRRPGRRGAPSGASGGTRRAAVASTGNWRSACSPTRTATVP